VDTKGVKKNTQKPTSGTDLQLRSFPVLEFSPRRPLVLFAKLIDFYEPDQFHQRISVGQKEAQKGKQRPKKAKRGQKNMANRGPTHGKQRPPQRNIWQTEAEKSRFPSNKPPT
jgi:hypothetical protein